MKTTIGKIKNSENRQLKILLLGASGQKTQNRAFSLDINETSNTNTLSIVRHRSVGVYIIAHVLKQQGHNVDIIDYIDHWPNEYLAKLTSKLYNYDIIGVSQMWSANGNIIKLLKDLKQNNPNAIVISGGQQNRVDINADYYITGFAENAIIDIINYHFFNGPELKLSTLFESAHINATHHHKSWPMDDYSWQVYEDDYWNFSIDVPFIELSRGCKFSCKFCNFPLIGIKEDTSASVDSLYKQIKWFKDKHDVRAFMFSDDTLNNNINQIKKLHTAVSQLNFNPLFGGFVRLDLMHSIPETLPLMSSTGIVAHWYGIETLNHLTGKIIGKGLHPQKIIDQHLRNQEYFNNNDNRQYFSTSSFIMGLPEEPVELFLENFDNYFNTIAKNDPNINLLIYPLYLHSAIGSTQINSFGVNMSKYSYEYMTATEIIDTLGKRFPHIFSDNSISSIEQEIKKFAGMFWKNKFTNFIDVNYNVLKLLKDPKYYPNINHNVSSIFDLRYNKDLNKLYFSSEADINHYYQNIQNYIKNKLLYIMSRR